MILPFVIPASAAPPPRDTSEI
jgi:hypothetical protein